MNRKAHEDLERKLDLEAIARSSVKPLMKPDQYVRRLREEIDELKLRVQVLEEATNGKQHEGAA